jgi:hypothetical protein
LWESLQGERSRWFPLAFVAGLPTALMISLRWKVGPDWASYASIYRFSALESFSDGLRREDPGFRILCSTLQQFHAPFWALNAVCGTVFVVGLLVFCSAQPKPWLTYLLAFPYLVIVVAMSGERQSVALGVLFLALNAFARAQLFRFTCLILAGALFHASLLLVLPIALLSYAGKPWQRALLLLIVVSFGVHFFHDTFSIYARRYSLEKIQSAGVIYRLAMNSIPAVIYLLWQKKFGVDEPQSKLWRYVALWTLSLIPLMAVVPSSTAIDRFLLYLFPLQFVVLGRVPSTFAADRKLAAVLTLLLIAYAAAIQAMFLTTGTYAKYYVPYRSILS